MYDKICFLHLKNEIPAEAIYYQKNKTWWSSHVSSKLAMMDLISLLERAFGWICTKTTETDAYIEITMEDLNVQA